MTDTTDIKALREKYELALKDLTERLMECNRLNYCMDEITAFAAFSSTLIDQLEAERQRADYAVKVKDNDEQTALYWAKIAAEALAEIAALKGDQVPVALVDERQGSGGFCLTQHGRRLNLQHGTELFTALQKKGGEDADD